VRTVGNSEIWKTEKTVRMTNREPMEEIVRTVGNGETLETVRTMGKRGFFLWYYYLKKLSFQELLVNSYVKYFHIGF